jgi:hypothetical protein
MIHKHKIEKLTEDEVNLFGYIINDSLSGREISSNEFCWLRPQAVFNTLNIYAGKIKQEYKPMIQAISDKLCN